MLAKLELQTQTFKVVISFITYVKTASGHRKDHPKYRSASTKDAFSDTSEYLELPCLFPAGGGPAGVHAGNSRAEPAAEAARGQPAEGGRA